MNRFYRKNKQNSKLLMAFTLAEVLMVMGILGVVAALTIPNLQNNMEDQKIVAKVQTIYAEVDQAYKVALRKYEDNWSDSSYPSRILEFMNTKNVCNKSNISSCANSNIKQLNTTLVTGVPNTTGAATFNDGSSILFFKDGAYIDIDGKGGFNTLGVDTFPISFDENGVNAGNGANASSVSNYTAWVLKIGNVDYLHCNTLSATGNTTCN